MTLFLFDVKLITSNYSFHGVAVNIVCLFKYVSLSNVLTALYHLVKRVEEEESCINFNRTKTATQIIMNWSIVVFTKWKQV